MDFELAQRGRASMDFVAELGLGGQALRAATNADAKRAGLQADKLAEDLDQRVAQVEAALAGSKNFRTYGLIAD
jgi:hypothetical protein